MAGAGKKTFTAGETLTASDVNTYLMEQSVMVFGGTAARSSAIPTPSEGMTTYRTDTQQIESYDGAEWRGMSGLQLVKKQTIGSAVSSVTVTGAFSATYDAYKIVLTNIVTSGSTSINMTFGSTATGYYYASTAALFSTANYSTQVGAANSANFVAMGNNGGAAASTMLEVSSPFTSTKTMFSSGYINVAGGAAGVVNGYVDNTTSYTAFTLTPGSGTLSSGTIYVYGYGT